MTGGAGLLGIWERDAAHGPSVPDPTLEGEVGRLVNILSPCPPPFSFFSCPLPKNGLDVGCSPITMWVSPQKKKKEEEEDGGGGLCEYSETTEINRAEKNSGKKSARLRVKGFYC